MSPLCVSEGSLVACEPTHGVLDLSVSYVAAVAGDAVVLAYAVAVFSVLTMGIIVGYILTGGFK